MNRAASGANETLARIVSGNFKAHWCSALRTEFHANDFLQIGIAGESAILLLIMLTQLLVTSRHVFISRLDLSLTLTLLLERIKQGIPRFSPYTSRTTVTCCSVRIDVLAAIY